MADDSQFVGALVMQRPDKRAEEQIRVFVAETLSASFLEERFETATSYYALS